MDVIYWLIPSMIIIGLFLVVLLFWLAKTGQYDDMDGEAYRILMDEDLEEKQRDGTTKPEPEKTDKETK